MLEESFTKRASALTAKVRTTWILSRTLTFIHSITSSHKSLLTSASSGNRNIIYKINQFQPNHNQNSE